MFLPKRKLYPAIPIAVAVAGTGGILAFEIRERTPETDALEGVYAPAPDRIDVRKMSPAETLGSVLTEAGLDGRERHSLLLAFQEHGDPRKIRIGTELRFRRRGERGRLRGMEIVERDRTIRLDRSESGGWVASTVSAPTTVDTLYVAGEIRASLWHAVMEHEELEGVLSGSRADLIDRLDKVFQWQVDFSRQIRAGDSYRFVFERQRRSDGSTHSGHILSAELVNRGRPYYAVWFDPNGDGVGTWYDFEGRSVRRAFLRKPLEFRRISSRFTPSRFHPILRRWRAHRGVDYAADAGTPVQATGSGIVARREWSETYGRVVDVRHPNGFLTRYAHLSGWAQNITPGSRVVQGQIIGYVGMTGLATAPHLHYEMHRSGRPIDPLVVELPQGDPVPGEDWDRWEREKTARVALLFSLPGPETFGAFRPNPRRVDTGS